MSITRATLLTATLVSLAACQSAGSTSSSQHDNVDHTATAVGEPIAGVRNGETVLRPGQTLSIILPSNSSTGFAWTVAPFDEAVVTRAQPFGEHVTKPHPDGMVGVPGDTHYRFIASAPGQTTIVFKYGQAWNPNAEPADTATYRIKVR